MQSAAAAVGGDVWHQQQPLKHLSQVTVVQALSALAGCTCSWAASWRH